MRTIARWSRPTCAGWSDARGRRGLAALALLVVTAGCAPFGLVESRRTAIGPTLTVEPQRQWTTIRSGRSELWTVDGVPLEAIRFVTPLAEGQALFAERGAKQPTFRATMTPTEIMELVVDSWAAAGAQQVQVSNLRPRKLGGLDGFGFDMTYLHRNGLEAQGMVVGAVAKQQLHLVIYTGTRLHYFEKYRPDVERRIDSIRIQ
jgi:hypothetical protein